MPVYVYMCMRMCIYAPSPSYIKQNDFLNNWLAVYHQNAHIYTRTRYVLYLSLLLLYHLPDRMHMITRGRRCRAGALQPSKASHVLRYSVTSQRCSSTRVAFWR